MHFSEPLNETEADFLVTMLEGTYASLQEDLKTAQGPDLEAVNFALDNCNSILIKITGEHVFPDTVPPDLER